MKILIVLLALVIVSGSSYQHKLNYTNKRSLTAVMTEVENKMKSHSPLDAVLNILTQFRDAVNTEQVNHDEIYSSQVAECQSEFQFRQAEILNAQTVLRDSNASLNVCQTSKIRATNQQQVNQQQTFNFESHLNTILATAEIEKVYFQKRSRQYEDSLQLIDEALDILQQLYNGYGSFVQLSQLSKDMLQISFETKLTSKYAPIFYAFSELAKQGESFDSSLLEQAQHLLHDLRNVIQNAYDEFSTSNAESVSLFNNQKEKVNKVLARLSAQGERLQNKVDHLSNCIGTQTAIVNTASSKLERNSIQLDQASVLCGTFMNEYSFATTARRNEIQLVSELEKMVIQRFEEVYDSKPELGFVRLNY